MADALVSVLMPIMNPNLAQLRKSLDSIKNQTYPNIECVIVFDSYAPRVDEQALSLIESSTIAKLNIIKRSKRDGFTNALNKGINVSSGQYIARLDSDDTCHSERIRKQVSYFTRSDCSLLGSWARLINSDGRVTSLFKPPYQQTGVRNNIMKHNPLVHSSIMFRKDAIQNIGGYDPNFNGSEDYELYLRMLGSGLKIENIPEFLVDIWQTENSLTRGSAWKRNRRMYIKSKVKAVSCYGFRRPSDILYCCLSPISLLFSPNVAELSKSFTGWYFRPDYHNN